MPVQCYDCEKLVAPLFAQRHGEWYCPYCLASFDPQSVEAGYVGYTMSARYC